jgi:hypothetical protein
VGRPLPSPPLPSVLVRGPTTQARGITGSAFCRSESLPPNIQLWGAVWTPMYRRGGTSSPGRPRWGDQENRKAKLSRELGWGGDNASQLLPVGHSSTQDFPPTSATAPNGPRVPKSLERVASRVTSKVVPGRTVEEPPIARMGPRSLSDPAQGTPLSPRSPGASWRRDGRRSWRSELRNGRGARAGRPVH